MSVDVPVLLALEGDLAEQAVLAAVGRPSNGLTIVRRCLDLADLLAVASTGTARAVVVTAGLRRLDQDAVDRLRRHGLTVVGLVAADQEEAEQRLRMLGVDQVVTVDAAEPGPGVDTLVALLRDAGRAVPTLAPSGEGAGGR